MLVKYLTYRIFISIVCIQCVQLKVLPNRKQKNLFFSVIIVINCIAPSNFSIKCIIIVCTVMCSWKYKVVAELDKCALVQMFERLLQWGTQSFEKCIQ